MNGHDMRTGARYLLLAWLLLCAGTALAQPRAWLDRDAIDAGDSVTLNIETDQPGAEPDYAPLQADFILGERSSGRQVRMANGRVGNIALFGVVLTPRRGGVLAVPALRVGAQVTAPLRLTVQDAPVAGRDGNAPAFVETEVDDPHPYVQQSVGVVVRLYYAAQLASGELDLDTPANASLQRVGNDRSFVREVGGRRYNVVERRFLLVPERSGPLQLAGARFSGRGVGGLFGDFFGRDNGRLSARAPDQVLQVRPLPAAAPQPWLPLKELQLRYLTRPQAARAGEALTLEVEARAVGATRAQFPDLPVPSLGDAAQVFAEPVQYDERFDGASPQLTLTRRYAIVPRQPGALSVPGIRLRWWDVAAGQERVASLPALELQVAPGSAAAAPPPLAQPPVATPVAGGDAVAVAVPARPSWLWPGLAAGFALLWLATLLWGLSRRYPAAVPAGRGTAPVPGGRHALADLRRALDVGALDEVAHILVGMGGVGSVDEVIARLDDPAQRQALERMQRARWGGGDDLAQVRERLREAFRGGPRWRGAAAPEAPVLAPLYPGDR
ncbi:membrane protein [Stenotrophomonas daejeonensis]|uniref:Membrane protein n=1 Tax=Stenotrophomonas daejeonensis TaxID=659018 RepID=A0A0R0EAP0_9GAMM|nr:BatD family protein [Stenotrophomonas daejeonensis]KRG87395.1 membrane protein [Stenotrophomonas daejeonensis]